MESLNKTLQVQRSEIAVAIDASGSADMGPEYLDVFPQTASEDRGEAAPPTAETLCEVIDAVRLPPTKAHVGVEEGTVMALAIPSNTSMPVTAGKALYLRSGEGEREGSSTDIHRSRSAKTLNHASTGVGVY